jgi:hypothetical protein
MCDASQTPATEPASAPALVETASPVASSEMAVVAEETPASSPVPETVGLVLTWRHFTV